MLKFEEQDIEQAKIVMDQMVVQGVRQAKLLVMLDGILRRGQAENTEKEEQG